MADRAAAEAHANLARLSTGDVQGLLSESTGSLWLKVLKVFRDSEVDGSILADHVATAGALRTFLREVLECEVNLLVATQLRNKLLLRAAQARVDHTAPPLGPQTNTLAFGGAPVTAVGGGHRVGGGGGGGAASGDTPAVVASGGGGCGGGGGGGGGEGGGGVGAARAAGGLGGTVGTAAGAGAASRRARDRGGAAAAAGAAAKDRRPQGWPSTGTKPCEACTFANTASATRCAVCDNPLPASERAMWSCSACTSRNSAMAVTCFMCETPRDGGGGPSARRRTGSGLARGAAAGDSGDGPAAAAAGDTDGGGGAAASERSISGTHFHVVLFGTPQLQAVWSCYCTLVPAAVPHAHACAHPSDRAYAPCAFCGRQVHIVSGAQRRKAVAEGVAAAPDRRSSSHLVLNTRLPMLRCCA